MRTSRPRRANALRLLVAFALLASGFVISVASVTNATTPALAATSCPPSPSQLDNGGFEAPVIPNNSYRQLADSTVPGWSTTATDRLIEIWSTPFNGVTAFEGRQFAELNATQTSALYQDLPTTPGQTLTWSLAHRARQGTDTMRVVIGSPGSPGAENARFSDTTAAWGRHTGTYVVPADQTITRFSFEAVSTGSGNPTVGNFLDDISFGTPSCVRATKEVSPTGPRNVGDEITYSITVENDGGSATSDVVITDALPAGLDYVVGSLLGAGSYDPTTRTITVRPSSSPNPPVAIGPGESVTVSFQARILPTASGTTLTNSATVAALDGLGVTDTFATNTVTTPVPISADVEVQKRFSPDQISSGGTTTMILAAKNNGPGVAQGVSITDTLPAGLTVNGGLPPSCGNVSGTISCAVGTLAVGQTTSFVISIAAPSVQSATSYMNTARVTSTTHDYDPSNNATIAGLSVAALAPASLEIAKVAVLSNVYAGDVDAVVIGVLNSGQTATASDLTVTDTIPSGFTALTATWENDTNSGNCTIGANVSCAIGALDPGNTAIVTVIGVTDSGLSSGTQLTDTASSSASGTNSPTATATITVGTVADLFVRKSTTSDALAGQTLNYSVVVENLGPSRANSVTLTDVLPAGVTVIAQPQNCTVAGATMTCALGNLDAGDALVLDYTVEIPLAGGTFVNTATATTTTPTINPSTATDTTTNIVVPAADLQVTKVASTSEAKVGDTVVFTVTVTNNGPGTATNTRVVDDGAVGALRLVSTQPSVGTVDEIAGIWTIGTLNPGESAVNRLTTVPTEGGVIINSVLAESDNPDNFGNNNTTFATVLVDGGGLPATGASTGRLVGLGGAFLLLGGIFVLASRRRFAP